MRTKIECPTSFIDLPSYNVSIDEINPECIIVDPGTKRYLDEKYFENYKDLKIVGTPSTGVSHIDVDYLRRQNIETYCLLDDRKSLDQITASAEYTWIHIMNGFRRFLLATKNTDMWRDIINENLLRTNEISSKNLLIIGLGRIGKKVKRYAKAFCMNVSYYDPYVEDMSIERIHNLENLNKYDCISVNCYLNKETTNLIDKFFLSSMKEDGILVNTSRGEVVNEKDLVDHLTKHDKFYYGADVLCNEQELNKLKNSKLYALSKKLDRVVVTPHVAGATIESQTKAFESIIKKCRDRYNERK